jgi:hypothetical protein
MTERYRVRVNAAHETETFSVRVIQDEEGFELRRYYLGGTWVFVAAFDVLVNAVRRAEQLVAQLERQGFEVVREIEVCPGCRDSFDPGPEQRVECEACAAEEQDRHAEWDMYRDLTAGQCHDVGLVQLWPAEEVLQ